jgi:cytidylate kinase
MGTVTIAATYGAGGSVIAPAVADRLGLCFIERAIPPAMAERIHAPLGAALADDEDRTSEIGRLLNSVLTSSGLFVGVTAQPESIGVLPEIAKSETEIRQIAHDCGAVILGRAGVFVLQGCPNVLHVRLGGDVEARRRAAMSHYGLDYARATAMQMHTDQARRAYVQHYYPRAGAWDDPRHYHLVLDSTVLGHAACTDIIVRAAQDMFCETAPASGGS